MRAFASQRAEECFFLPLFDQARSNSAPDAFLPSFSGECYLLNFPLRITNRLDLSRQFGKNTASSGKKSGSIKQQILFSQFMRIKWRCFDLLIQQWISCVRRLMALKLDPLSADLLAKAAM